MNSMVWEQYNMKIRSLLILLICFLFSGCEVKPLPQTKIFVEKVFMSTTSKYIVMIKNDNFYEMKYYWTNGHNKSPSIFCDVASTDSAYIVITTNGRLESLQEIHLRTINDLLPGQWDSGKFGSGTNVDLTHNP